MLVHLRYAEIAIMLRMSARIGKRGCVKTFLAAVRFSLTLWATTHARDYCRLACDLLIFWKCASPAMKELYAREMFTRIDATGHSVPTDYYMEKSIRHTRGREGKKYRGGLEKSMEYTAMAITNETTQSQTHQTLRTGCTSAKTSRSRATEYLTDKSPLLKSFEHIHNKLQFWHPTNDPIIEERKKRKRDEGPDLYKLPSNESLNPDVIRCFDIGLERATLYLQRYYIDEQYTVERSGKEVTLSKILATSADRKIERIKTIHAAISTSRDELDKALNKEEAGRYLADVIQKLNNLRVTPSVPLIPPGTMSKINKKDRINELIKHRRRLFGQDSLAESRLKSSAIAAFELKYPPSLTEQVRGEIMESKFFCLSDDILGQSRYSNAVN